MSNASMQNLGTARIKIKEYLSNIMEVDDDASLAKQIEFLNKIDTWMNEIEKTIKHWGMNESLIARYNQNIHKTNVMVPTNQLLLAEVKQRNIETHNYVLSAVKTLRDSLITEIGDEYSLAPDYRNLLKIAKQSADEVIRNAERFDADAQFKSFSRLYNYAQLLGATIYPCNQPRDPLFGKSPGYCTGLKRRWAERLKKDKPLYNIKHNVIDYKVSFFQLNSEIRKSTKDHFFLDKGNELARYRVILDLFEQLNPEKAYYLSFIHHLIGVRKVAEGHIEIYDANFGLFIFPDTEAAARWFDFLLKHVPQYQSTYHLKRYIGGEPCRSTSSIPYNELSANSLVFSVNYVKRYLKSGNDRTLYPHAQYALLKLHNNQIPLTYMIKNSSDNALQQKLDELNSNIRTCFSLESMNQLRLTQDSDAIKDEVIKLLTVELNHNKAISELVQKIHEIPDYIEIKVVLDDWLRTRPKVNDQLIEQCYQTEISYPLLELKRMEALNQIVMQLNLLKTKKTLSPHFQDIIITFNNALISHLNIKECFDALIKLAQQYYNKINDSHFFEEAYTSFDRACCEWFLKINPNNLQSLNSFIKETSDLAEHYKQFTQQFVFYQAQNVLVQILLKYNPSGVIMPDSFEELNCMVLKSVIAKQMTLTEYDQVIRALPYSFIQDNISCELPYLIVLKNVVGQLEVVDQLINTILQAKTLDEIVLSHSSLDTKINIELSELIQLLGHYDDQSPRGACLLQAFCERNQLVFINHSQLSWRAMNMLGKL